MKDEKPYIFVKDLIKILEQLDSKMPIGTCGYFGEFYAMDTYHFHPKKTMDDKTVWLNVSTPYIGPEPD